MNMEDQHENGIVPNPPKLHKEKYIQNSISLLFYPKWSELPPIVLEKIYSYLDRTDQSQMSLVCRKWCQKYSFPSLWRTMKVTFPQTLHSGNICQAVRFAQRYGQAFRHVEIACRRVGLNEATCMENQLKEFLETLTYLSQLSSVCFKRMYCPYENQYENKVFKEILPKLISFLLSQNKLESVVFRNSEFKRSEALEIRKAIFTKDNGTLKHLALWRFSSEVSYDDFRMYVIDMPSTYDILMNLRKIEIDYTEIECLITSCYEYGNGRKLPKMGMLEEMYITCLDSELYDCLGIPPDAWKYFTEKCQSLKVKLAAQVQYVNVNEFEKIIVRHMPITLLDFCYTKPYSQDYDDIGICHLFSHFLACKINIYLEEIILIGVKNTNNFHSNLINFLQTCPRLSTLELSLEHPVEALDEFISSLLCNKPSFLETVVITIDSDSGFTEQDELYYSNISDHFAPLLLATKVTLDLSIRDEY